MPTPATATPPAEAGFDPTVFWIQHKSKILLLTALFVVAIGAYGTSEHLRNKRNAAAEAALATAQSAEDYRKLISEYAGTAPAGSAHLLLAEKLRAEGKYDESTTLLHSFLEKYPENPLLSSAWTSIAANLEAQGKVDEALSTYQKVSTAYANSFSAPVALLGQARLLAQKGKTEEARRLYEQVLAQYQDNFVASQVASQELRKLKK